MDALAQVEPVARALLREVDAALHQLGAPAEHAVWPLLRRVGATPAAAVTFFATTAPEPIRAAADALYDQIDHYSAATIPPAPTWQGAAGEGYAARARALNEHLGAAGGGMVARVRATASYAEEVARWFAESRDQVAAALLTALTCAQAVTLTGPPAPAPVTAAAAADIAAHVLGTIAGALDCGGEVCRRHAGLADEMGPPSGAGAPAGSSDMIDVLPW